MTLDLDGPSFFFTLIEVVRFGSDISITALAVVKSRCL